MLKEIETTTVGDAVYDHLSVAVAHATSAQHFIIQGDREAVARWIDEAESDLAAARAALAAQPHRELRRPLKVTEELAGRDL